MKLLKKLLWLGATLCTALGLCLSVTACNDGGSADESSTEDANGAFVYRVSVQNETGFGFSGVTVSLMDGDDVVASAETNTTGNANFLEDDVVAGKYTIEVEDIPDGYVFADNYTYKTSEVVGTTTTIVIKPTGLLQGTPSSSTYYKLGDIVHDFTITLSDGTSYTLSEVLAEKDMVLLNFWATWCGPCLSEFPSMHLAAQAYADTVSILAIDNDDTETRAEVASFKANYHYDSFNMAAAKDDLAANNLRGRFRVSGIPHTVIIDRYGVVAFNHVGTMPSLSMFTTQFDKFVGEDYIPTIVSSLDEEENNTNGEQERIEPTVTAPKVADLKDLFTTPSTKDVSFRYQEKGIADKTDKDYDKYNWPWSLNEEEGYIYASNVNINSSYAILYMDITVKAGDVLTFDYQIGTEANADFFYVMLDSSVVQKYSGYHSDQWYTSYSYVFKDYEAGEHQVSFVYLKDSDTMANDDVVRLKDLRILSLEDLNAEGVDANIFRNAATKLNADPNAATQYENYVDVFLNEEDGYYHVGAVNGPVLYANLITATPWNNVGVWTLTYNDYIVGDGMNFRDAIEDFAWEATQVTSVNGYTPVTPDLRYLLEATVKYTTVEQKWAGETHENEWLEVCVYWEHYGPTPLPEDPMAGITFAAAIPLQAGENGSTPNKVSVPYAINPRGFKYKFTPKVSGAYKVYSVGTKNPEVFLVDGDRRTHLGYWDDKIFVDYIQDENGNDISDSNFEFYWYFEAGETYYMLFTTYLNEPATYDVYIDYLGESYTYRTNAAVGPYSANLNTFELFLPDAIEYEYADPAKNYVYESTGKEAVGDGYYHKLNKDGTLGSVIYLDVYRPTAFFTSVSLKQICEEAKAYSDETKRALYLNGIDYTDTFTTICNVAIRDGEGFAAVDQSLFELLQILTLSDKYEGIETSWLLLCYYDETLSASNH